MRPDLMIRFLLQLNHVPCGCVIAKELSFLRTCHISFSSHIFSWACVNPGIKFICFCAFTYNSLISGWISAKLGSALPLMHACMLYLSSYCLFVKDYYTAS